MTGKIKSFTLIELVMVIVVLGVVGSLGVAAMLQTTNAWVLGSSVQNETVMEAMSVMNRMAREMRNVKNNASIVAASPSNIAFVYPFTVASSAVIAFDRFSATSKLRRGAGVTTILSNLTYDDLADNVSALSFTYYDDSGNDLGSSPGLMNICGIETTITISSGGLERYFQFRVYPRNLVTSNEEFK